MRYYLGIDGGGTKTAALISDENCVTQGLGIGGPGNLASNNEGTLRRSLREALRLALQAADLTPETHFSSVCAGMAGFSATLRVASFDEILRAQVSSDSYRIEPDYITAYWGATLGETGIVVIAGTGAVAYGRNAEGQERKEDGLGYHGHRHHLQTV